jgi:hypothetical protein
VDDPVTLHSEPVRFTGAEQLQIGTGTRGEADPSSQYMPVYNDFTFEAKGLQIVSYKTSPYTEGTTFHVIWPQQQPPSAESLRKQQANNVRKEKFLLLKSYAAQTYAPKAAYKKMGHALIGKVQFSQGAPSYLAAEKDIAAAIYDNKIVAFDPEKTVLFKEIPIKGSKPVARLDISPDLMTFGHTVSGTDDQRG